MTSFELFDAIEKDNMGFVHEYFEPKSVVVNEFIIVNAINRVKSGDMMITLLTCIGRKMFDCFNRKDSMLWYALRAGQDIEVVKEIVEFFNDIVNDVDDNCSATPLIYCVKNDLDIDLIKLLLKHGADVNKCDSYGFAALHYVSNVDVVKILIEYDANVNARNRFHVTPLMYALLYKKDITVVIELIRSGADINAYDNCNNTVLMAALRSSNDNSVIIGLVKLGAYLQVWNDLNETPLYLALSSRYDKKIISFLIKSGGLLVDISDTLLVTALSNNYDKDIILELIDNGAPVNPNRLKVPLFFAISHCCDKEIIIRLIQKGADVNHKSYCCGVSVLLYALNYSVDYELITELINAGADCKWKSKLGKGVLEHTSDDKLRALFLQLGCTATEAVDHSSFSSMIHCCFDCNVSKISSSCIQRSP